MWTVREFNSRNQDGWCLNKALISIFNYEYCLLQQKYRCRSSCRLTLFIFLACDVIYLMCPYGSHFQYVEWNKENPFPDPGTDRKIIRAQTRWPQFVTMRIQWTQQKWAGLMSESNQQVEAKWCSQISSWAQAERRTWKPETAWSTAVFSCPAWSSITKLVSESSPVTSDGAFAGSGSLGRVEELCGCPLVGESCPHSGGAKLHFSAGEEVEAEKQKTKLLSLNAYWLNLFDTHCILFWTKTKKDLYK